MKGDNKFAASLLILPIILDLLGFTGGTAGINWDESCQQTGTSWSRWKNTFWSFHHVLFFTGTDKHL